MDMQLSAEIILIQGDTAQLVAGTAEEPYQNNFELILRGNHTTPDQPLPNGPNLGAKALGVCGKLQMHGQDVGRTWTRLAATAAAGAAIDCCSTAGASPPPREQRSRTRKGAWAEPPVSRPALPQLLTRPGTVTR